MRKTFVIAIAAIALLFAAAVAAVAHLTAPLPSTAASKAGGQEQEPAGAAAAEAAGTTAATARPDAMVLAVPLTSGGRSSKEFVLPPSIPTPRPPVRPDWLEGATQRLGPRKDSTPLGPLRPYVASGMSRLQVAVAGCADEAPPQAAAGGPDRPAKMKTTLSLQLETLDNQIRIVDAVPRSGERADDWRVQCAQRKLRGQTFYAPSKAGARLEIPFVLKL